MSHYTQRGEINHCKMFLDWNLASAPGIIVQALRVWAYPKPWLLSRALWGIQEEYQPVYCS